MEIQDQVDLQDPKQPYVAPLLVRHGTVEELTEAQATPITVTDGVSIVI